ncbi:MAG: GNAT family N-acetyltransferase [Clostridia bacterium]|nr:GNAT family N-acetyltransferase [Clostridia bacterium]
MTIKTYTALPKEAAQIRQEVFVEEQGFREEFDTVDNSAYHVVLFTDGKAVATCRYFADENGSYIVGRIAVLKKYRNKGLGSAVLRAAEEQIKQLGGDSVFLHSQLRAAEFYEKLGYFSYGEIEFEEDCPHIWMKKELR